MSLEFFFNSSSVARLTRLVLSAVIMVILFRGKSQTARLLGITFAGATAFNVILLVTDAMLPPFTDYFDPVDVASRLESLTKVFGSGIIVREETLHKLTSSFPQRSLGIVRVKGKRPAVAIYEILSGVDPLDELKLQARGLLDEALRQYQSSVLNLALDGFGKVLTINPDIRWQRFMRSGLCNSNVMAKPPVGKMIC